MPNMTDLIDQVRQLTIAVKSEAISSSEEFEDLTKALKDFDETVTKTLRGYTDTLKLDCIDPDKYYRASVGPCSDVYFKGSSVTYKATYEYLHIDFCLVIDLTMMFSSYSAHNGYLAKASDIVESLEEISEEDYNGAKEMCIKSIKEV